MGIYECIWVLCGGCGSRVAAGVAAAVLQLRLRLRGCVPAALGCAQLYHGCVAVAWWLRLRGCGCGGGALAAGGGFGSAVAAARCVAIRLYGCGRLWLCGCAASFHAVWVPAC